MESDPRRPAMVPSSITVTPFAATRWPINPASAEADRYLLDPRVFLARVGVDRLEQIDLGLEGRRAERVLVAIEPDIGARGCLGVPPGVAAANGADRLDGPRECLVRQVRSMGI